jgi:hypothetical protein
MMIVTAMSLHYTGNESVFASNMDVKVQPVNLRHENRVQVVASGSGQDIEYSYREYR